MADRYPLIVDSSTSTVKELPSGDNLNLSGSGIVNVSNIETTTGIFTGSTDGDLVQITQTGNGNALVVRDSSPDSTPALVVTGIGSVGIGTTQVLPSQGGDSIALSVGGNVGVGIGTTENFIVFRGTTGDDQTPFHSTWIGERIWNLDSPNSGGRESSELFLAKLNDQGVGSTVFYSPDPGITSFTPNLDRIRLAAAGGIVFQTHEPGIVGNEFTGKDGFYTFDDIARDPGLKTRMFINSTGQIGIGTTTMIKVAGATETVDQEAIKLYVAGHVAVGVGTTQNYMCFRGTTNDDQSNELNNFGPRPHTFIGERIWNYPDSTYPNRESSELLFIKANDNAVSGQEIDNPNSGNLDRIRFAAAGAIMFQTHEGTVAGNSFAGLNGDMSFDDLARDPGLRTRMTIDNDGNIGIATTNGASRFHLLGTFRYDERPSAASVTTLGVDASGIVRESSSSRRFKENIQNYEKGLSDVVNLNPVTFNYIGEEGVTLGGLIAEEVHDAGLTEFVVYEEDKETPKAINYGHMMALMTNAVKELKAENDSLKSELAAIKAHLGL